MDWSSVENSKLCQTSVLNFVSLTFILFCFETKTKFPIILHVLYSIYGLEEKETCHFTVHCTCTCTYLHVKYTFTSTCTCRSTWSQINDFTVYRCIGLL